MEHSTLPEAISATQRGTAYVVSLNL